ncbi:hypothetical protein LXL04_025340 [Taraxacum kok-saghyz]
MRRYNKSGSSNPRGSGSSSQQNVDSPPQQEGYRPTFDPVQYQSQMAFQAWMQTQYPQPQYPQPQYQQPQYPQPQYPQPQYQQPQLPLPNFTYHSTLKKFASGKLPKKSKTPTWRLCVKFASVIFYLPFLPWDKTLERKEKEYTSIRQDAPPHMHSTGCKAYFRMQLLSAHNWVHDTCHLGSSESFLSPIALTCFWKEYFGSDFVNKSA